MIDSKGQVFGCFGAAWIETAAAQEEKREQAPALQAQLSTTLIIARSKGKSRAISVSDGGEGGRLGSGGACGSAGREAGGRCAGSRRSRGSGRRRRGERWHRREASGRGLRIAD